MRHETTSVVIGIAVVILVAAATVQDPLATQRDPLPARGEQQAPPIEQLPRPVDDPDEGPAVPEDWPEHWPRPQYLDEAEIRAVESATYLYSTWYGSPQAGLSPAAALAAHRGQEFERFIQFGDRPYLVPRGSLGAGDTFHFLLTQAIVDAAFHLCPDGMWPELLERSPRTAGEIRFANVIGPGDRVRGFSRPNPVHCYWNHMPAARWSGSTLVAPPRFDEVWGREEPGTDSTSDR